MIKAQDSDLKTLCEDPVIHAADRLKNETYRVYRGNHYWELIGLPPKEKSAQVRGPFFLPYPKMKPFDKKMFVFTIIGGHWDGFTHQFDSDKSYLLWSPNNTYLMNSTFGDPLNYYDTAYNDGDLEKKKYSKLIAFMGDLVFYYNTSQEMFKAIGVESGKGHLHGAFGEKFPSNLTAAFPIPSNNPKVEYYVYLFRKDKYCFRPIYPRELTSDEFCPEWRDNS